MQGQMNSMDGADMIPPELTFQMDLWLALNKTSDGLLVVDSGTGKVLFANRQAETLFGKSQSALQKSEFGYPLIYGEKTIIEVFNGLSYHVVEMRATDLTWLTRPALLVVLRGISSHVRGYEVLKRQNKELLDHARVLTHDLTSYIAKIQMFSDLIGESGDRIAEVEEYRRKILDLTGGMKTLLSQSFKLATYGETIDKSEVVSLESLLDEVAELVSLEVHYAPLPNVIGDKTRLTQVFLNLARNALEHGKATELVVSWLASAHAYLNLRVANNGSPLERSKDLFDLPPPSAFPNRGLGLYIVKKFIEAHNWEIKLECRDPVVFQISIPIADLVQ